jgi:hypothetical protein
MALDDDPTLMRRIYLATRDLDSLFSVDDATEYVNDDRWFPVAKRQVATVLRCECDIAQPDTDDRLLRHASTRHGDRYWWTTLEEEDEHEQV